MYMYFRSSFACAWHVSLFDNFLSVSSYYTGSDQFPTFYCKVKKDNYVEELNFNAQSVQSLCYVWLHTTFFLALVWCF